MRPDCWKCKADDALVMDVTVACDLRLHDDGIGSITSEMIRQDARIRCTKCGEILLSAESRVQAVSDLLDTRRAIAAQRGSA